MAVDWATILGAITGTLAAGLPAVFALGKAFGRIEHLEALCEQFRKQLHAQAERFGEGGADLKERVSVLEHRAQIVRPGRGRRGTQGVPAYLEPEESTEG